MPKIITILYIIVFIFVTFLTYQSLKAFDYAKVLRRDKTRELYFLMFIVSFICGYLCAEAISTLLERITNFIAA